MPNVCKIIRPLLDDEIFIEALVIDNELQNLVECSLNALGGEFTTTLFMICLRISDEGLWDSIFDDEERYNSLL